MSIQAHNNQNYLPENVKKTKVTDSRLVVSVAQGILFSNLLIMNYISFNITRKTAGTNVLFTNTIEAILFLFFLSFGKN